jgi:hypothetical protein
MHSLESLEEPRSPSLHPPPPADVFLPHIGHLHTLFLRCIPIINRDIVAATKRLLKTNLIPIDYA